MNEVLVEATAADAEGAAEDEARVEDGRTLELAEMLNTDWEADEETAELEARADELDGRTEATELELELELGATEEDEDETFDEVTIELEDEVRVELLEGRLMAGRVMAARVEELVARVEEEDDVVVDELERVVDVLEDEEVVSREEDDDVVVEDVVRTELDELVVRVEEEEEVVVLGVAVANARPIGRPRMPALLAVGASELDEDVVGSVWVLDERVVEDEDEAELEEELELRELELEPAVARKPSAKAKTRPAGTAETCCAVPRQSRAVAMCSKSMVGCRTGRCGREPLSIC